MNVFTEYVNNLWEKTKPPLEKIWDGMVGESNWEPDQLKERTFYTLPSIKDVYWCGSQILAGQNFPCHLCNEVDLWVAEGTVSKEGVFTVKVFVHEHEPVSIGMATIRQVSTVPPRLVDMRNITESKKRSKNNFRG